MKSNLSNYLGYVMRIYTIISIIGMIGVKKTESKEIIQVGGWIESQSTSISPSKRQRYHSGIKLARQLNTCFDKQFQNVTFGKEPNKNHKILSPLKKQSNNKQLKPAFRIFGEKQKRAISEQKRKRRNLFIRYQSPQKKCQIQCEKS